FTDVTGDIVGAVLLSDGRDNIQHVIEIKGNRFEKCVASGIGTVAVLNTKSTAQDQLMINNNHFISCSGDPTGGIYVYYKDYNTFELNQNTFQSNLRAGQEDNYGCDAYIRKMTILNVQDGVQYYRNAFTTSTTNNPYSVYYSYEVSVGSNSGYLNLRSTSGQCWASQFESGGNNDGCTCTSQAHPNSCTCPTNVPTYTTAQCQFDKLPSCTGTSQPSGGCRCLPSIYPSYCQCPLNDLDVSYTKTQCDYDKIPPCTISTTTPSGGCKCTIEKHPIQPTPCTCPLNNAGEYTKAQCEIDTTPEPVDVDPTPTDPFDCERDLQADTPTYRCACPDKEDKAKW
ncbi:MAG: hypothetical protein EZS28_050871, partial [Streblomastix strix]